MMGWPCLPDDRHYTERTVCLTLLHSAKCEMLLFISVILCIISASALGIYVSICKNYGTHTTQSYNVQWVSSLFELTFAEPIH